jgi:hypothetical protein
MTRLRLRSIRRSLAVLLLLCFGLYGIESEVADVHERAPGLEMVVTPQMDGSWCVPTGLPGTHPLPRLRPPIA